MYHFHSSPLKASCAGLPSNIQQMAGMWHSVGAPPEFGTLKWDWHDSLGLTAVELCCLCLGSWRAVTLHVSRHCADSEGEVLEVGQRDNCPALDSLAAAVILKPN